MFSKVTSVGGSKQTVVDILFDYLNHSSHHGEFIEDAANKHRTLQQCFIKLCVAWLEHLATLKEYQYDARNQDSVELAKAITQTDAWEKHKYLRCI